MFVQQQSDPSVRGRAEGQIAAVRDASLFMADGWGTAAASAGQLLQDQCRCCESCDH